MRTKFSLPAVAVTAVVTTPIVAHATTVISFSFTGGSSGTVSGVLDFGSDIGVETPIGGQITAAPAFFGLALPLSFTNQVGIFSFSSGHIVGGSYFATAGDARLFLNLFSFQNALSVAGIGGTTNNSGVSGANYSSGPVATPEPASIVLLGAGLAGIAGFRRRRARS